MNKVELLGRLTRDIELKRTSTDTSRASFIVAVNGRKKQDGTREADFIPCLAFGKTAEILSEWFHKGNRIALVGRIRTGSYDKDGVRIYTTDIIVEDFDFIEPKNQSQASAAEWPEVDDGDLPF